MACRQARDCPSNVQEGYTVYQYIAYRTPLHSSSSDTVKKIEALVSDNINCGIDLDLLLPTLWFVERTSTTRSSQSVTSQLRTFAPKTSHAQILLKLLLQVENDKIRLKTKKKSGVAELVLKIRRITNHSICRISSHSRRFWPDSLLSAYISIEESYVSYVCLTQHI